MTKEQQQLIHLIACQLFGTETKESDGADWHIVLREARQQTVFPLAFQAIKGSIPAEELPQYATEYAANQASYIRNLHDHAELDRLLDQIPYVILKGQASASFYPDPMLRSMGDVDFLVHLEDREKVDQLLRAEGFQKLSGAEKHEYHWRYTKNQMTAELHWDLPGVPESMKNRFPADAVDTAEERSFQQGKMMFPSLFYHGLVLLLHTVSHMTGGGIGLRHLCDWLVFENSVPEREFLAIFEKRLKDIGLWTFARVMTRIGVLYFGTKRSWCQDADEEVCCGLLEDIFSGGNFGVKDGTRRSQDKLIKNQVTKSVHGSVIKNGLVSINEKAKRDYPFCRNHAILRPAGWAAVVGQYVIRVIGGKRTNVFDRKTMDAAVNRQKLYAELKLFE